MCARAVRARVCQCTLAACGALRMNQIETLAGCGAAWFGHHGTEYDGEQQSGRALFGCEINEAALISLGAIAGFHRSSISTMHYGSMPWGLGAAHHRGLMLPAFRRQNMGHECVQMPFLSAMLLCTRSSHLRQAAVFSTLLLFKRAVASEAGGYQRLA